MKARGRCVHLDVLRALAGLAVPMLHLQESFVFARRSGDWTLDFCGHNYFAVEFYLLLMAYMFGAAYDHRWDEGMGLWEFAKRRLRRLHPLVVSGVVLGGLVFALQAAGFAWAGSSQLVGQSVGLQIWAFVSGLLVLPACGFTFIAPLNPCSWTLYYQYLGNVLYALFVRRMSRWMLAVAAALSAVALAVYVFHPELNALFGTHADFLTRLAHRRSVSFDGGWGMSDIHIAAGLVRLAFPLFFGLLVFRLGWKIRLPKVVATILVPVVFVAFMFVPAGKGSIFALSSVWNGVLELAFVFVFLPFILLVGIGSDAPGGRFAQIADFFGRLSFPVYMSHFMFMPILQKYVAVCSAKVSFAANVGVFALTYLVILLIGYGVMRFWEKALPTNRPVRPA